MLSEMQAKPAAVAAIDEIPLSVPVAVVMTDLDGLADLNARRGKDVGTAVLTGFSEVLRQNTPDDALLFRVGGDEWAGVFPGLTVETALVLMEELRAHVASGPMGGTDEVIYLSAGVAGRPSHGGTGEEILRAADEALMAAKRAGRNRVSIYVEDKMVMKSNYYSRATLDRLASLSRSTNRTEASLLREAAGKLLAEYAEVI